MPRRINENVQSILDVPASVLPSGAARDYLLEAADAGQDVYAYSPIQLEQRPELRRYNVWLAGQRYDLQAWLAHFYDRWNNGGCSITGQEERVGCSHDQSRDTE